MEKVILISGSPRKEGNTALALEKCKEVIEKENVQAEIISLAGRKIEGCIACYKCRETKRCSLNDDVNEIMDRIREAGGLIVGAPVYFGTPRGDLMNLLQRVGMVSRGTDKFLKWKVGGPIAVARRGGLSTSYQEMLMFYFINNMIVPGADYWNIVFGAQPGDALNDTEGMETIRDFSQNVAKLVNILAKER